MKKNFKRSLSVLMVLVMVLSTLCVTASAAASVYDTSVSNGYYKIIAQNSYTLCPGATETEIILNNADYTRRQVVHVIEVDVNNENVEIVPGYYGIDKDTSLIQNQQSAKLTDMAAYYEENLGYNIVGGMNTDLTYSSQAPRVLVYNGKVIGDKGPQTMLCVYKDEDGNVSCEMRSSLRGDEWQAVGCSFGFVVKDGQLVKKEERTTAAASRSMIGVKADGTLVICQVDGRQAPYSVGLSDYEEGETMLALGCEWAVNCDGGGSSTFITQREGEDELVMRSSPSDGSERPTIHGVFVASNAKPTGVFDHANISAEYDYFAPGTTYTFDVQGIDGNGYAAEIPAEAVWTLSDASFGTIANGAFTSNGTLGQVDIQMEYDGAVVGKKTINVVDPDAISFSQAEMTLPYGKALALDITATYGVFDVYYQADTFDVALSNASAGSVDGLTFNATDDESVTGTDITATYKYSSELAPITISVTFGKGSEVIWDFEDENFIEDWRGVDNIGEWLDENAPEAIYPKETDAKNYSNYAPNGTTSNVFVATRENGGQVKNGNYSLGVKFDEVHNAGVGSWTYNYVYYVGEHVTFRDVAAGKSPTSIGMWVYAPEEAVGTYFRLTDSNGASADVKLNTSYTYMLLPDGSKFSAISGAKIPEAGWIYISIPLTANYHGTSVLDSANRTLVDGGSNYYPAFIQFFCGTTDLTAKNITFYIDDVTLDYSAAVDDRDAPVISAPSYALQDTAYEINGQTVTTNEIAFSATVADVAASNTSGLDYTTAAIYVDGNKIENVKVAGSTISMDSIILPDGVHSVCFEIADKLGNYAKLTKEITVAANSEAPAITLAGHNDLGIVPETDSVYYVDLVTDDIEKIDTVTTELYLNTANTWELDHMIVADGFTAEYSFNEISNIATITLAKTGDVDADETVLASLPARLWSWDVEGTGVAAETQYATKYCPIVTFDCDVISGKVTYTDAALGNFYGSFDGSISVETKINDVVNPWHYHTAEAVADVAATCTADGCEGKTYCAVCGSVVDWGTAVPATGHNYVFIDGVLQCEYCNDLFNGTYEDGKDYADGVVVADGWSGNNDCYYVDGVKLTGSHLIDGIICTFDENGAYLANNLYDGFFQDANGWMYILSNIPAKSAWVQIGDDWYYFRGNGYAATGTVTLAGRDYRFEGEQGKCLGAWAQESDGLRYYYCAKYYKNAWAEIDGATYYFENDGLFCTGTRAIAHNGRWVGAYEFDAEGKLVGAITGVFTDAESGTVYYAIDGEIQKGLGLIKVDGDYYYVRSAGYVVSNASYYVDKNNDYGFPAGSYRFDVDGKMITLNGIVEENGVLYYYINGVPQKGLGLLKIGTSFYYNRSAGYLVSGRTWYIDKDNAYGIPAGSYMFAEDGKMIISGIIEQDGLLYYYVDGVAQKGLGLIKVDGDYYYVRSAGYLVTGRTWYVDRDNEFGFPAGSYNFGEDGKMLYLNGIVEKNGVLYYYVDGVPQKGLGLIEIDGDYYYNRSAGYLVAGRTWYIDKDNAYGFAAGSYMFGEDGKMIPKN